MNKGVGKKVFVAMSGGVDSSVAAFLLKNQGYNVVGVFMRCYNLDGCAERDARDARLVAETIGVPFYVWDFEDEYKKGVVDYMIDGYRQGLTPNPDVMCNKEIKFGLFLKRAIASGANYVATGHYVSLRRFARTDGPVTPAATGHLPSRRDYSGTAGNRANRASESSSQNGLAQFGLFAAKDRNKDQSYFLWTLTQNQLKHCLFPIGDYLKSEVREIAKGAHLPTAGKKDSQGICFLGKITLDDFLRKHIPEKRGGVLTTAGNKIGEHNGAQFYTIGQRHIGANFQFPKTNSQKDRSPFYVAQKNITNNLIIVAEGSDNPALYKKEVELTNVNFINPEWKIENRELKITVLARVRYRQPLASAELKIENSELKIIFDSPQKFVAAGQSAVLYSKDGEMLGGGIIS